MTQKKTFNESLLFVGEPEISLLWQRVQLLLISEKEIWDLLSIYSALLRKNTPSLKGTRKLINQTAAKIAYHSHKKNVPVPLTQ